MTYVTDELRKMFANHVLELIQEGAITGYYMREPGTRNCLVLLTFSPEGITITGDLTPEPNGSVSVYGYDLNWFAGQMSEAYLCGKFLTYRWLPELAVAEIRDPEGWIRAEIVDDVERDDGDRAEDLAILNSLADSLEADECGVHGMIDRLNAVRIQCEEVPGYGDDPKEVRVLCAIQQKFRQLYWAGNNTKGRRDECNT